MNDMRLSKQFEENILLTDQTWKAKDVALIKWLLNLELLPTCTRLFMFLSLNRWYFTSCLRAKHGFYQYLRTCKVLDCKYNLFEIRGISSVLLSLQFYVISYYRVCLQRVLLATNYCISFVLIKATLLIKEVVFNYPKSFKLTFWKGNKLGGKAIAISGAEMAEHFLQLNLI